MKFLFRLPSSSAAKPRLLLLLLVLHPHTSLASPTEANCFEMSPEYSLDPEDTAESAMSYSWPGQLRGAASGVLNGSGRLMDELY